MKTKSEKLDRRSFLKTTGMGSASLILSAGLSGRLMAAETPAGSAITEIPTRVLGKTGARVPILSLGGIIDWTSNQALLRMAYNMGLTYWDTSHGYMNGKSEIGIGRYFEKYPGDRKKIFLVSKASGTNDPEGMTNRLDLSLERMKTDHVDLYFMHGPKTPKVFTPEVKAWAEQKKKEKKIKFFGFSTHMNIAPMLTHAASLGWIDAVMTSYNYRLMADDDIMKGIDACAEAGIGLVAMKVMAMRYSGSESEAELGPVQSFMESGMTLEQAKLKAVWKDERIASSCVAIKSLTVLRDNVAAAADGRELTGRQHDVLRRLAADTRSSYCRACGRCAAIMGDGCAVPEVLRYLMYYHSYGERDLAREQFRQLPDDVRNVLAARDYTSAEKVCPQGIRIASAMREASNLLASSYDL